MFSLLRLQTMLRIKLLIILASLSLLLLFDLSFGLSSANANSSSGSGSNNTVTDMKSFEEAIKNVVTDATDWSYNTGLGIMSLSALYSLIFRLLDGGGK